MKSKNGFTFVELLAVITIIGVLALILLPTIERITQESKEKVYNQQLNNIILSLKSWASDNKQYLPEEDGEVLTITLGNLKSDGYIEYDVKNPLNGKCFDNSVALIITKRNKTYDYSIDLDTIKESDECEAETDGPMIVLNGNMIEDVEINSIYVDKGVKAKDKNGNDITSDVITTITGSGNVVNTSNLSNQYIITYSVTSNGKTAKTSRTIKIVDTTAPELVIPGDLTINTNILNLDITEGVSVTDNSGENIEVTTKSNINFGVAGKYTITYTAVDSSGNKTTKKRIITIKGMSIIISDHDCLKPGNKCSEDEIKSDIGIKATVNVKDGLGYDFYVVSDTETEVTLIMSENLGQSSWISLTDYENASGSSQCSGYTCGDLGPISALKHLNSQTLQWDNISKMNYVYNNPGNFGYKKLETVDGVSTLTSYSGGTNIVEGETKARLLTSEEAINLGCSADVGSCPAWLYENLSHFWLLSADASILETVTSIFNDGYMSESVERYYMPNEVLGIRPVITISKDS